MGDDAHSALELLAATGAEIVVAVGRVVPGWAQERARVIVDAWDRHTPDERERIVADAAAAGARAAARVQGEMATLLDQDPDAQRLTPLQVLRSVHREVTAVLSDAGIPPVVRDEFDERVLPDDLYDLSPRTLGDLGGDELTRLQIAWGAAKAMVHKERRAGP